MAGGVAQPFEAIDLGKLPEQLSKAPSFSAQSCTAISIHILAEQCDLADATLHKSAGFRFDLRDGPRILRAARVRHHAEGTELVATFLHGQKSRRSLCSRDRQRIEF